MIYHSKMDIKRIKKYRYHIGIDPGIHTGVAIWDSVECKFEMILTTKIHLAFELVKTFGTSFPGEVLVKIEDARKRNWYGKNAKNKQQGAGAIKIQCTQWEDFLNEQKGADYQMIDPKSQKGYTKLDAAKFKRMTGYDKQTSEHARDAAMMVFGT